MTSNNTFYPTEGKLGVQLKSSGNSTSPSFQLGERVSGNSGTEWVYAKAAAAIAQYDYVTIDEDYNASKGTKAAVDDGHMIAAAQWAFASAEYGWFVMKGADDNLKVNAAAGCAPDVTLYTSGTAGVLDDTATGFTRIDGIVAYSSATATTTPVQVILTWPKSTTF